MEIDLLSLDIATASGAHVQDQTFVVTAPWGSLELQPISLRAGWYELAMSPVLEAISLLLISEDGRRIEISKRAQTSRMVRLQDGPYTPVLTPAARPGTYPAAAVKLRRVSWLQLALRARSRILGSLAKGNLSALWQAALRTTGRRYSGLQTDGRPGLGPLTQIDFIRTGALDEPVHVPDNVAIRLKGDPILSASPEDGSKASRSAAFTIYVGAGDRLTPDAVSRFQAAADANPQASVFIADAWIDGVPTVRSAFDPLLYAGGYPTPYAVRAGFTIPHDQPWSEQQRHFSIIPVPLAHSTTPFPSEPLRRHAATHAPVSVIIPTRDRADLLAGCLDGLSRTRWDMLDIIIVDNQSEEAETLSLFETWSARGVRIIKGDFPFNFSRLCNLGARQAGGDHLVFMNNDIIVDDPDWLLKMLSSAAHPDVGAVGARLLYENGNLQHGGIALGLGDTVGHLWRNLPKGEQGKVPQLIFPSLRSAVTGALLCVSRDDFWSVDGFDEDNFPVTFNDADLCMRLRQRGKYTVLSDAEAYHLEGASRGLDDVDDAKWHRRQTEIRAFRARWAAAIEDDPWLPMAASRSTETFLWR